MKYVSLKDVCWFCFYVTQNVLDNQTILIPDRYKTKKESQLLVVVVWCYGIYLLFQYLEDFL